MSVVDAAAIDQPPGPDEPTANTLLLSLIGLGLILVGLGVSIYLTVAHYDSSTTLACPDRGTINCAKVTSSSYSMIFGVPVALAGAVYFVALIPLYLPRAWRSTSPAVRLARLGLVGAGVVMVLWLVYAELFRLNAICLWCTVVHVVTVVLFGITAFGTAATMPAGGDIGGIADIGEDRGARASNRTSAGRFSLP